MLHLLDIIRLFIILRIISTQFTQWFPLLPVDIQHKTKAAARAHTIFRRGAKFGSDLYTSKEPARPKRAQLDLQTKTPNQTPINNPITGVCWGRQKEVGSSNSTKPIDNRPAGVRTPQKLIDGGTQSADCSNLFSRR